MRTAQQFSITLPLEMAEAVERWLREEVVAGHAVYLSDPSKGFRPMRFGSAQGRAAP